MKKVLIIAAVLVIGAVGQVYAACSIEKLESCTADINSGFGNTNLRDRILPNRMNDLTQPNSSFNNRNTQGQSHTPNNINMEPINKENTQPYNANCQFGNCMNRTNTGADNDE